MTKYEYLTDLELRDFLASLSISLLSPDKKKKIILGRIGDLKNKIDEFIKMYESIDFKDLEDDAPGYAFFITSSLHCWKNRFNDLASGDLFVLEYIKAKETIGNAKTMLESEKLKSSSIDRIMKLVKDCEDLVSLRNIYAKIICFDESINQENTIIKMWVNSLAPALNHALNSAIKCGYIVERPTCFTRGAKIKCKDYCYLAKKFGLTDAKAVELFYDAENKPTKITTFAKNVNNAKNSKIQDMKNQIDSLFSEHI